MYDVSINKWSVSRFFLAASRTHFNNAVEFLKEYMEKMSGQKVGLNIAFYKAAQQDEIENAEHPKPKQLIAEINTATAPSKLWRKADYIEAHFTTAASPQCQALHVVMTARWPDDREFYFQAEPSTAGDTLGRHFLNENPQFQLWTRSIR
jgi:hypothetical protein